MHSFVAYPVALLAAMTFAGSAVLQQRSAREVPEDESLNASFVAALLRRRAWLAGVGAMVLAYVLQAAALGFGPVAVVEPIIVTELVFAVPIAVRRAGKRPGPREWAGMVLAAGGVGAFLLAAHPTGGVVAPPALHWLYGFAPWAAVGAVLLLVARGPESPRRAGLLAAAAGVTFGLMSLITKSAVGVLSHHGFVGFLTTWQPWVLLVIGAAGFLVSQSAYQAAPLASSLPVMDTIEPITAVLFSAYILGERITLAPLDLGVELAGAGVAIAGVFLLGRSPLVLAIYESTEQQKRQQAGVGEGGDAGEGSGAAAPAGESGPGRRRTGDCSRSA